MAIRYEKGGTEWPRRLTFPIRPGSGHLGGLRRVSLALTAPSHVRRVLVCTPVDVGGCRDADNREQDDPAGESPAAVGLGGYEAVDVFGHGAECSRTWFHPG